MVPVGDPERVDKIVELPDEQVDRPEVGAPLRVVRAPAVADLVVEDDSAAVLREVGEHEQVVVRRAGAAVKGDEWGGSIRVARTEVAVDSVPRLGDVTVEAKGSLGFSHGRNLFSGGRSSQI